MSTPIFSIQTNTINLLPGGPFSIKFLSKDSGGTPVDVSSGYTVGGAFIGPASDVNTFASPVSVTSTGTYTFDTTGVTWSLTEAQQASLINSLPTLHGTLQLQVSNDAGTTKSNLAVSPLAISTINGLANT